MKKQITLIFLVCLILPILIRGLWFYQGFYLQIPGAQPPDYIAKNISQPTLSTLVPVEAKIKSQKNQVVFDLAHTNRFSMSEIEALTNALIVKGAEIESIANAKDLADSLRMANALVIIAPTEEFSNEDVQAIRDFTDRGGKLLFIADPTRTYQDYYFDLEDSVQIANHVLEPYGLAFQTDYVYSISHNEGNFRNVYASPSGESELTRNVKQVVFYGTHSISGQMNALLAGDQTTLSSSTDSGGNLVLGALSKNGQVLALGDMGFITSPYYQVSDNYQLVLNIANFLAGEARSRTLTDFPDLFTRPVIVLQTKDISFNKELLSALSDLQATYQPFGISVSTASQAQNNSDLIVLGLYPPSEEINPFIVSFGIDFSPSAAIQGESSPTITPPPAAVGSAAESIATLAPTPTQFTLSNLSSGNNFLIPGFGTIPSKGFSLVLFENSADRNTLILLAETKEKLTDLLKLINTGSLEGCMMQDHIAICPGETTGKTVIVPTSTPIAHTPIPPVSPMETPAG